MWETSRAWDRAVTAARTRKADAGELQSLNQDWHMEYQMLEDEYEAIYSRRLVNKAIRLRIPYPEPPYGGEGDEDENWRPGEYRGWLLKPEGTKKIRAEIRAERRARTEQLVQWATLLIGLIGAATGLMAVILR